MTPKERAAMQQALEALLRSIPDEALLVYEPEEADEFHRKAITSLREALSEPVRKCDGLLCNDCGDYKKKYKGLPGLTEKDLCVCEPAEPDCGGAQHHRYCGSFGD